MEFDLGCSFVWLGIDDEWARVGARARASSACALTLASSKNVLNAVCVCAQFSASFILG